MAMFPINSRHESIEEPTVCMICVKRGDKWYQMRPLSEPIAHSKKVISRLRSKGREISERWVVRMGLGGV